MMIGPILYLNVAQRNVSSGGYIAVSLYGIIIVSYYVLQSVLAVLNHFSMNRVSNLSRFDTNKRHVLVVVGYREDPDLFRGCLEAADLISGIENIIVVVDGCDAEDEGMVDVFKDTLNGTVMTIDDDISMATSSQTLDTVKQILETKKSICISQPHLGKREALYTGIINAINCSYDAVLLTDSDTCIDRDALRELSKVLFANENTAAVTGDVKILNAVSLVSFLASVKYYLAFNIDRGAQSLFGCVGCVSGPLGLYKLSCVSDVIEDWKTQSFLGSQCTFGDDRHLTNRVLSLGRNVKYTHKAVCFTETPTGLHKWILQQTRWSKSFFRELFFCVSWIDKQSLWLSFELVYQTFYPFLVTGIVVYILVMRSFTVIVFWMVVVFCLNLLRGVVVALIECDLRFIFVSLYSIVYVGLTIPIRVYALITLFTSGGSWLTSSRIQKQTWVWSSVILPVAWVSFITAFFIRALVVETRHSTTTREFYVSLIALGTLFLVVAVKLSCLLIMKACGALHLRSIKLLPTTTTTTSTSA